MEPRELDLTLESRQNGLSTRYFSRPMTSKAQSKANRQDSKMCAKANRIDNPQKQGAFTSQINFAYARPLISGIDKEKFQGAIDPLCRIELGV